MRRERPAVASRLVLLVALASLLYAVGTPAFGSRARLPRCSPEGYGLELQPVPETAQRQPAVRLTVGWLTGMERRRSCLLKTTIRLAILDGGGVAVKARWNVIAVRRPWSGVVRTWLWRNWCVAEQQATVEVSLPRGEPLSQLVHAPPTCANAGAASTVTALGTGTKHVTRPANPIPPHILPKGAPPPLHAELIEVKNAWLVGDGYTLVAVYAGAAGHNAKIGRLAIVRQNEIFGIQYPPDLVDVGRVGAIEITRAPRGASRETSAQHGKLDFVSADGTRGVLELEGDRVRVVRKRG